MPSFYPGLLCAVVLALPASAQVSYQVVGPTPAPFTFSSGGTAILATGTSQSVALPFAFQFYGQSYTSVSVSQYGFLTFAGGTTSFNYGIPHTTNSTSIPATFIAPWWDGLFRTTLAPATTYRYAVTGVAPQRIVTFEWRDTYVSTTATRFSFQVKLYEGSNQIRIAYGPSSPSTSSASVGIQGALGVGVAALSCTTPTSGVCSTADFPVNQVIDFYLPPDLSIASLNGEQVGYAGVPFRSTAVLRNGGGRTAVGAQVRFFLSADAAYDTSDALVGESAPVDLASGAEALVSASAPIPSGTAPGSYFLVAVADPDNTLTELTKTNNVSSPLPLTVGPPTPDLEVTGVSAPLVATPGQAVALGRQVTNRGNAPVPNGFKYTYFLSDNSAVSISDRALLVVSSTASLAAGTFDSASDSVTLPTDVAAGQYWIGVCVDYDPGASPPSELSEISEVNNCARAATSLVMDTGVLTVLTTSLDGATQHAPYGLRLQALGGNGSYTWEQTGGQLPVGIQLTPAGDLLGTPSTAGAFAFSVKVRSGAAEASTALTLTVTPSNLPLAIVDQELPTAELARGYQTQLVAVGGKPPYRWAPKDPAELPVGIAMSSDGRLEGRALAVGEFPFTVVLADSNATLEKNLRLRVVAPGALQIVTFQLATAFLGKNYVQNLQAIGGRPPYDWSVVRFQKLAESPTERSGTPEISLPRSIGLSLQEDAAGRDQLRGAPGAAGLFAITLRVQDSSGTDDSTTLLLRVRYDEALAITTTSLPDAFVGKPYAARLSHNGGPQAVDIQFSVPCVVQVLPGLEDFGCASVGPNQSLPNGLVLGASGDISGTPADSPALPVVHSFLVQVTDAAGRQDVRSLSIKVRNDFDTGGGCGCTNAPAGAALLVLGALILWRRRQSDRI